MFHSLKRKLTEWKHLGFPKRLEKRFVRLWSQVLTENAGVYTGIYAGISRTADGSKSKKPQSALSEWYARTRYKWEDEEIMDICRKTIQPVIDRADAQECAKWAALLLKAMELAGIQPESQREIILDEKTIKAYTEWNGEEIYEGDLVEVFQPAWYQNNVVIEQGYCIIKQDAERSTLPFHSI